jgi:hypothetical protein
MGVTPRCVRLLRYVLWAARHTHGPISLPYLSLLLRRPRLRRSVTRSVGPVLPSSELDRTEVF